MIKSIRIRLYSIFTMLLILNMLTACAVPKVWTPQKGQVVDWNTKEPIAEAIVVASWKGDFLAVVHSIETCYHVESTITDESGYFKIPMYMDGPKILIGKFVSFWAFKPGYKTSTYKREGKSGLYFRDDLKRNIYYLEKDHRPVKERLEYLSSISSGCGAEDGSEKNLLVYLRALYEEAKSIAVTKEDKKKTEYILYKLEKIELGYDEAQKRHLERP